MSEVAARIRRSILRLADGESRLFFRNSAWLFGDRTVHAGLVFVRSIVLARGLGPELFGGLMVVAALVATVQEFFNLNVSSAIIKFGASYREEGRPDRLAALLKGSYLFTGVLALLAVAVVAAVVSVSYGIFLEVPDLEAYILFFALCSALSLFDSLGKGLLRLFDRFKINALVNMGATAVDLAVVTAVVVLFPGRVDYLLVAFGLLRAVTSIAVGWAVYLELRAHVPNVVRPAFSEVRSVAEETWRFVVGTSGSNTLKRLIRQGDVVLLGALVAPAQVGFYAIAKKLASTLLVAVDPLAHSIYPQLARLVSRRSYGDLKQMLQNVMRIISTPLAVGVLLLLVFGRQFITLVYGVEFAAAHMILVWIVLALSIDAVFFWTVSLLNSLDLVAVRFKVYALSAVIGLALSLVLVPVMGAAGMAVALIGVNLLTQLSFAWVNYRKIAVLAA